MENKDKYKNCTKEDKDNMSFSIAFNKDGDSFQKVMEKILMSKLESN